VPEAFERAMDEDLNVPQALAVVHETVRSGNTALTEGNLEEARQALHHVHDMLRVLGLNDVASGAVADTRESAALSVLVEAQLAARAQARASKDWAASDAIRDTLKAAGVAVEDGPDGAVWTLQRD
jgi:cysteinyl-tRNA synthetase